MPGLLCCVTFVSVEQAAQTQVWGMPIKALVPLIKQEGGTIMSALLHTSLCHHSLPVSCLPQVHRSPPRRLRCHRRPS
jgi:hypothetical protein